ncbi:hypothetical protein FBU30_002269, partial [Linnemannia zychae]
LVSGKGYAGRWGHSSSAHTEMDINVLLPQEYRGNENKLKIAPIPPQLQDALVMPKSSHSPFEVDIFDLFSAITCDIFTQDIWGLVVNKQGRHQHILSGSPLEITGLLRLWMAPNRVKKTKEFRKRYVEEKKASVSNQGTPRRILWKRWKQGYIRKCDQLAKALIKDLTLQSSLALLYSHMSLRPPNAPPRTHPALEQPISITEQAAEVESEVPLENMNSDDLDNIIDDEDEASIETSNEPSAA